MHVFHKNHIYTCLNITIFWLTRIWTFYVIVCKVNADVLSLTYSLEERGDTLALVLFRLGLPIKSCNAKSSICSVYIVIPENLSHRKRVSKMASCHLTLVQGHMNVIKK